MGYLSGIRRRVKKIIPKEVRPFIPYAAAMIPGANLGLGAFAKSNPAMYKALMAGGTKFLTDDEADLKDVGITATLAAAPTALEKFSGSGPTDKGIAGALRRGAGSVAQKAKDSPYLTTAGQAGTDVGIKQAELNKKAIEEYEASLLSQGIKNKSDRRSAIFNIFVNNGYEEEDVNVMLDRYGYSKGGDVEEFEVEEMDEEIITPMDLKQEEGVPIGPLAGPDWYIKRVELLEYLGYSYEEASEIAFDSDKYYSIVGLDSKKDMPTDMKMASDPDPMDELNSLSLMLYKKPLSALTEDEYEALQEAARESLESGGKVKKMQKASMTGFGEGLSEHYKKLLEKKKRKSKADGGIARLGFKEGDTVMKKEFADVFAQLIKPVEFGGSGMSTEDAMEFINTKFPEEFKEGKFSDNLSQAIGGIETALGEPIGGRRPEPMRIIPGFAVGGDVEDVEMMDEEFVGDDELRMEEGVQIGPMAEEGETETEVLLAMKVSPGLIDEYRNYVFELKELGMEHQIAPFRDWFRNTYGGARMGVKEGGAIKKPKRTIRIGIGKAGDYPGMKKIIEMNKKGKKRFSKAEGGSAGYKLNDFALAEEPLRMGFKLYYLKDDPEAGTFDADTVREMLYGGQYSSGGRISAEEGGLMNLGGKEMDLRGGGFVPMGKAERADDVPARLSKNEFVFTADAVRAAGGGSVDKGADLMYDTMKKLEAQV
jgi:hypothetical protein